MEEKTWSYNPKLATEGKVWDQSSLYKTSTMNQSEKNALAMKNSTEQLLKTRSKNLKSTSTNEESLNKKLDVADFRVYDQSNHFKTSYHEMDSRQPTQSLNYYIPKYSGFVPGMKSENPFGTTYTRSTHEQLLLFEKKRNQEEDKREQRYNPMSKTIGSCYQNKTKLAPQNVEATYDPYLRQSGYSINLLAKSPAGIICPNFIESDPNQKSEYRCSFNKKRDVHYKGPMFSTGILKQCQKSYF